jgi:hypothetical protein
MILVQLRSVQSQQGGKLPAPVVLRQPRPLRDADSTSQTTPWSRTLPPKMIKITTRVSVRQTTDNRLLYEPSTVTRRQNPVKEWCWLRARRFTCLGGTTDHRSTGGDD